VVVGVKAAAVLLAQLTGLRDVAPADVREVAERGLVRVVTPGEWPMVEVDVPAGTGVRLSLDWPMPYLIGAPNELASPNCPLAVELRRIGEERRAWRAASMLGFDAAEELGVRMEDFTELAARHGVQPGRWSRYARTDIERLRRALLAASSARRTLAG
jgi:hypothetical protein